MNSALLQNLISGGESGSQFFAGLIVALLFAVIGLLSAVGSILIFRQIFQGRWEQIFWASFLVVIAGFYLSFAAYFQAPTNAWKTELTAVIVFFVCALIGLFFRPVIALGYVMHGIWDLSHSLSATLLAGVALAEIPLGYGVFCLFYDLVIAFYVMRNSRKWNEPGKFEPFFWRHVF
jgi:FtsH-binding integral membrane protein